MKDITTQSEPAWVTAARERAQLRIAAKDKTIKWAVRLPDGRFMSNALLLPGSQKMPYTRTENIDNAIAFITRAVALGAIESYDTSPGSVAVPFHPKVK